jgi:hypothetical protein
MNLSSFHFLELSKIYVQEGFILYGQQSQKALHFQFPYSSNSLQNGMAKIMMTNQPLTDIMHQAV